MPRVCGGTEKYMPIIKGNYIGIDLDKMWLKILRIGKNLDGFMREKNVLVYDLVNQKVITNY